MKLALPGHRWRPSLEERRAAAQRGFTLLELLVVISIVALATAGVGLAMRDSGQALLERDAARLAALLDRLDEIQTTYDVCETAVTRAVESIRL